MEWLCAIEIIDRWINRVKLWWDFDIISKQKNKLLTNRFVDYAFYIILIIWMNQSLKNTRKIWK